MKKGDRFVAYRYLRPAHRLFIEVTRVAKDKTWADIFVCTWAVGWSKRQPLQDGRFPFSVSHDFTDADMNEQEADHMALLSEAEAS